MPHYSLHSPITSSLPSMHCSSPLDGEPTSSTFACANEGPTLQHLFLHFPSNLCAQELRSILQKDVF